LQEDYGHVFREAHPESEETVERLSYNNRHIWESVAGEAKNGRLTECPKKIFSAHA